MKKGCVTLPRFLTPDKVQVSQTLLKDLVSTLWNSCNVLRYDISDSCVRIVPGKYDFCADWNEHRFSKKRPAQPISCCNQPFNGDLFNFNKLKDAEILLEVEVSDQAECVSVSMESGRSLIVVNDSPLSPHHVLLLPMPKSGLNQRLTQESLELGLSYIISCGDPDTRVVFNSLLAFASVNHLHLHAYQCSEVLPIESAKVGHVTGCCFVLTDYPVPGFVFALQTDTVQLAQSVIVLVELLQELDIPHNMMMSYGDPCIPSDVTHPQPVIRVCVWPVKSSNQLPEDLLFRPAVCEISGHVLLHDTPLFNSITEQQVIDTIKVTVLDSEKFDEIVDIVKIRLEAKE